MKPGFERVAQMAKDLGVILELEGEESLVDSVCPFSLYLGIRWPNTLVILDRPDWHGEWLGDMIHELGHICCTNDTEKCEWRFFGWEFLVAQKYDLLEEWMKSSKDYGVPVAANECTDFGWLSPDEQSEVLEHTVGLARESGYIVGDEPLGFTA